MILAILYFYNTERNTPTLIKILKEIDIILVKKNVEEIETNLFFLEENVQWRKTVSRI